MKKFKIYYTSDTHGYLLPMDYATNTPKHAGLLSCGFDYDKDGNTLVIDGGDTIQGSPFTLFSHKLKMPVHPVATALNGAGYDFVTLGNHDFNYGEAHLSEYLNALDAQCLCANVSGDLPILPYAIKTLENGLRIGIVGIVTDWVNIWEKPEHIKNLTITDPFEAAKNALADLNGTDMNICLYHGGFECDVVTGEKLTESTENIAYKIASDLDFDLMLTGHQHMPVEGAMINGTYVVQPQDKAVHYLQIEGTVTDEGVTFTSQFKEPTGKFDSKQAKDIAAIESQVQKWLDAPVGFLDQPLTPDDKVSMALNGTPLADFFNQVQLEATGADISVTSLGNEVKGFQKEVTVRDVVSTYIYPNTIVVLSITGKQLKAVLERAASYLEPGPKVSKAFLQPKIEHYNYDYFAGVTYTNTLSNPVGERVSNILVNGKEIHDSDTFTICMNNYRATGAGGYDSYKDCPVVKEYQTEMSELIIEFLSRHKHVSVTRFPAPKYV
ncbi:MAG: bifunctional metallophosphatase/5'-nucleotidase [Turicibacter sp.]|nr:bifunctional metallophosphatase/5'-nucleotidase [Turicibacter sp.]